MKRIIYLIALSCCLFIASCNKDVIEVEGPTGPQGATGATGPAGTPGMDGNANIISRNITYYVSDFVEQGTPGEQLHKYTATKSISDITDDVYNNGAVIVYYRGFGSSVPWYSLPQTIYENGGTYTLTYAHSLGQLTVQKYDADLTSEPPSFDLHLKVIILPSMYGKKDIPINWDKYEEVKDYFNLKD